MDKTKNEIISKLLTIKNDADTPDVYRQWIEQTLEFIGEK